MASNSAASSLARSVSNAVDAVLLAGVLALLVLEVIGLLVLNLVALLGSVVAGLAVLWFSSIVTIFLFLVFVHHHQQCKKKENIFLPQ